jgi:putative ABC transport system permease protein
MRFLRILSESFVLAVQQLLSNKLRTLLSLMGIIIGIWCVIMVLSAVNSLEYSIRKSFKKLGDNTIYISTMPWGEDPRENFWKYMRRPEASYTDYLSIKKNCKSADIVAFNVFIGTQATESKTATASGVLYIGVTEDYREMFGLEFVYGRYFTASEFFHGTNDVVIGYEVYKKLFREGEDPIGKSIKAKGQKLKIIGVLKKEGKDLINPINFDNVSIVPYNTARKYVNTSNSEFNRGRTSVSVKARQEVSIDQLSDELVGVLRASRKLKPKEEDNFALNTLSILSNLLGSIFGVINLAGVFIGGFAIFVGMFSVANIMFVSVKERTNIIGIKKALGAKKYVILTEFLVESIVLCLVGGLIGLVFVYLAALAATLIFQFEIFLSAKNMIIGITIAAISGVVAGIIPALNAANMEAVDAMRSK